MAVSVGKSSIVSSNLVLYLDASSPSNYSLTEVEVLVVAGGGAGGGRHAGGGGAGGVIYVTSHVVSTGSAITVTVGNGGGAGGYGSRGGNGQNSVFQSLTAIGGGGGGGYADGAATVIGASGGSGGGGAGAGGLAGGNGSGGAGTAGQGNRGGDPWTSGWPGGGGGGAGAPGQSPRNGLFGGRGGDGLLYNISGTPRYYAGGGGGGGEGNVDLNGALGGLGGGGRSTGSYSGVIGQPGQSNTGGGGGGSRDDVGSAGGSGVVIVRYPGPQKATGGNTITQVGGYTIHTFTTSGTFTPSAAPANAGAVYGLQDLSGNNNTATQSGGVTYSTANGGSLSFNGSSQYATITSGTNFTFGTGDFSMECWYNPAISYANGNGYIFDAGANGTRFQLYTNRLYFMLQGQVANVTTNTGVGISPDIWYNAVGTRVNSIINLYLNGSIIGSNNANYNLSDSGGTIGNYGGGGGYFFNGKISVLRIYKGKGLTATEISQNFNAQRGRFGI